KPATRASPPGRRQAPPRRARKCVWNRSELRLPSRGAAERLSVAGRPRPRGPGGPIHPHATCHARAAGNSSVHKEETMSRQSLFAFTLLSSVLAGCSAIGDALEWPLCTPEEAAAVCAG